MDRTRTVLEVDAARQRAARYARIHQDRVRGMLDLLAASGGRCFATDLYGAFLEESVRRRWPVIGYRRLLQILATLGSCPLCGHGEALVRLEVRSFGRFGRRTIVELIRLSPRDVPR